MAEPQVLVVGAGPTGLALALWLAKLGIPVRIIDKSAGPAPYSRALGVQARTLEFYSQLNGAGRTVTGNDGVTNLHLVDEIVEGGCKVAGINLWVRGYKAARIPFQNIGDGLSPYPFVLVFPQDAHERLLLERLDASGVTVERGTELLRFDRRRDNVRAVLKLPDGSENVCEVAYLAGCDGARSTVRDSLKISFRGGTYSRLFYVADVDATGPAIDGELHVDLEQADLLAVFPMKGKGRVRFVGTMVDKSADEERALTFDDVRGRALEHLKLTVSKVNWFSTYRVHHRVAGHFRRGRGFLLGDAAHIHSPVGAQGMNTGIGDAVNLAWKLAAVLKNRAPADLLDTYEFERMQFARHLVGTTDRVFTIATKSGAVAERIRTQLVPRVMSVLFQLRPLRRFLFRTLAQLRVNYRNSRLSSGKAGGVRGGDRLPWFRIASDRDNFASLSSLSWQVHVYGDPRPGVADACAELELPLINFAWRPEMKRAGLMRGAIYLIRPDGYVALADSVGAPNRLRRYFKKRGFHC